MSEFVNYKKRGIQLPKGCKDLADVLKLQGIGFVAHSRHRDDPDDYKHVLGHDCNPAYEQEKALWKDAHPMAFGDSMTREEKRAVIQKWADESYHRMRDWISSSRPE